jgi:hypothetical protein
MCIADCCGEELMRALSQLSRSVNATGPEGGPNHRIVVALEMPAVQQQPLRIAPAEAQSRDLPAQRFIRRGAER